MKKLRKILCSVLAILMLAGIGLGFNNKTNIVSATSATTYTRALNSDNYVVRSQDGYIPESTYDRIGLSSPQDMVIDKVIEDGKEVEYGYILNQGVSSEGGPFLTKFKLSDLTNDSTNVKQIYLNDTKANRQLVTPTGLWLQTTTVNGQTHKEIYIADGSASIAAPGYKDSKVQRYTGLIYRFRFDENDEINFNDTYVIHVPTQACPVSADGTSSCVKEYDDKGNLTYEQTIMNKVAFGQNTEFKPVKVAVDSAGNIFVASKGTSSGLIELTYSGEFVSFFAVNSTSYNFLYQFIKKYGTAAQLEKLNVSAPSSFENVYVDKDDLVYSMTMNIDIPFVKYSTAGSSILTKKVTFPYTTVNTQGVPQIQVTDCYVTDDGLIFITLQTGMIYVYSPDGNLIFFFGTSQASDTSTPDIIGFFSQLSAITVDSNNRIWAIDSKKSFIQTFITTEYSASIFEAITAFNNHDYETSQKAWERVLNYDSLSVLANEGLGKAYYYNLDFNNSLEYFKKAKDRTLYSNVFWELRNDFLQQNLSIIILIAAGVIILILLIKYLFNKVNKLKEFKAKVAKFKETRFFKDLTVGFRLIRKPADTFYELKVNRRGSVWGATVYYILAIIAMLLNTYCYALPFQYLTINTISVGTVLFGTVAVLMVFVLCNYLVSAINNGEGTFKDIYKFTGYCLLPMIICLPLAVGISYGLTLNEQVIVTFLKALAFWGSGIMLAIGILQVHNYTFGQTVKNIVLTIIFMILFAIVCIVVYVMIDQIIYLIKTIWKEVKLRAGWY